MEEYILSSRHYGGRGEPGMRRRDAKPGMRVMTPDGPGVVMITPASGWCGSGRYIPVKLDEPAKFPGTRYMDYIPRAVKELRDE
jgi:hypothetical protein